MFLAVSAGYWPKPLAPSDAHFARVLWVSALFALSAALLWPSATGRKQPSDTRDDGPGNFGILGIFGSVFWLACDWAEAEPPVVGFASSSAGRLALKRRPSRNTL